MSPLFLESFSLDGQTNIILILGINLINLIFRKLVPGAGACQVKGQIHEWIKCHITYVEKQK